jgi:hypothetical protein
VEEFIKQCNVCQQAKHEHYRTLGLLTPLPIPEQAWWGEGQRETNGGGGGGTGAESNSFARTGLCLKFKPQSQNPIRR